MDKPKKIKPMTQSQIKYAEYELGRIRRDKRSVVSQSIPDVSYEENEAWKEKHPSPSMKRQRLVEKKMAPLEKKIDGIIFSAKMGIITAEEMNKIVEILHCELKEV